MCWTPVIPLTTSSAFITTEEEGDTACQHLCVCVWKPVSMCVCGSHLGHYIHRHEKAGYNDTHPSMWQGQIERGRVFIWASVTSTCDHLSLTLSCDIKVTEEILCVKRKEKENWTDADILKSYMFYYGETHSLLACVCVRAWEKEETLATLPTWWQNVAMCVTDSVCVRHVCVPTMSLLGSQVNRQTGHHGNSATLGPLCAKS